MRNTARRADEPARKSLNTESRQGLLRPFRFLPVCACLTAAAISSCTLAPAVDGFPVELPTAIRNDTRIAVVGDLQMTPWLVRTLRRSEFNEAEQAMLVEDLQERAGELDALIIVGDLVFTPRARRQWARFDRLIGPMAGRLPVLPAMGNHDYNCVFVELCSQRRIPGNVKIRFPWLEPGAAYIVAYGDLGLVFLDSETALPEQGEWLRNMLPEIERRFEAVLIFTHRPPFTDSSIGSLAPGHTELQQYIVSALADSPVVPVFISGHVHGYEHLRVDGVHYVVSGGGGGPRRFLLPNRRRDVYSGRDCRRDEAGGALRPFNYLLIERRTERLNITVRGFCRGDAGIRVVESFDIPLPVWAGTDSD